MGSLGTRIAIARRAAGKTQMQLAADLGADVGTVSRYERGAVRPGVDAVVALARACGVDLDWLLTGEGDAPATGTDG